jgi:hypothetical protein
MVWLGGVMRPQHSEGQRLERSGVWYLYFTFTHYQCMAVALSIVGLM